MIHTLFAVIGTTAQVLTEAIYALHKAGKQVDAIELITTRSGKEAIYSLLLSDDKTGAYYRYLDEYRIPLDSIKFSQENITVLTKPDGKEIDDITSKVAKLSIKSTGRHFNVSYGILLEKSLISLVPA